MSDSKPVDPVDEQGSEETTEDKPKRRRIVRSRSGAADKAEESAEEERDEKDEPATDGADDDDDDRDDDESPTEEGDDDDDGDRDDDDDDKDAGGDRDDESRTEGGARGRGPRRRRGRGRRDEAPVEPRDEREARALEFVTDLIEKMEMDCSVRLRPPRPDADNEIGVEISGRDAGRIIGKKGQVLSALQFLTNRVVNRPGLERRYVAVDAEGYRSRREGSLATMAQRLGKQAVDDGKIITFEPMNPRDRRVVHLALAKFDGVVTKSEGEGDDRRVQIIPVRR